jgi:hypothetical protein
LLALGFLCLSRLSNVVELDKTNYIWNLKNKVITTKNTIWNKNPIVLITVCAEN